MRCLTESGLKVAILRENFSTHKNSTYSKCKDIVNELGVKTNKLGKNTNDIIFENGSSIIFIGLSDPEKLKSLNGVTMAFVEELSEITEDGFEELKGRLRTGDVRILLSTNPMTKMNWVYKSFFEGKLTIEQLIENGEMIIDGVKYIHSTVFDNPFVNQTYVNRLLNYKITNPYRYQTGVLGKFGELGDRVFTRWTVESCQHVQGETLYGLDLGYAVSHNRLLRVVRQGEKLYITHEYDSIGLTNEELCKDIIEWSTENSLYLNQIFTDSSEPKAIQTLQNKRIPAVACEKIGIVNQIDRIRDYEIIIDPSCKITIGELDSLVYKEVRGMKRDDRFNFDAHSVDSLAYALSFQVRANLKGVSLQSRHY